MKTCLFMGPTCNNIFNEEHIIQKGLGGTLKSADLTCEACNQYFGNEVDPKLIEIYRPIIQIIQPLLSGDLKEKIRKVKSLNGKDELKIYPGGHVEKNKLEKKYDDKGHIREIISSSRMNKDQLEKIAQTATTSSETYYTEGEYGEKIYITDSLLRAIILDLLKLIKYVCMKNELPDLSYHDCLKDLRRWVRLGIPANYIPTKYPFAPISDILDGMFNPCIFSHRFIIYFNCNEKKMLFVAEFVNTMPWLVIIENSNIFKTSLLIKYQKNLIPSWNSQEEPSIVYDASLNWKDLDWRKFATIPKKEARNFAWLKFHQQYCEQIGKAQYEVDMRTEETLLRDIEVIRLNYKEHNITEKVPEIVSDLVKTNRYRYHLYAEEIKKICYQKAKSMSSRWYTNKKIEMNDIISVYRSCLKMIVEDPQFGYPQNVRLI